jgi:FkbM family methyltransferase
MEATFRLRLPTRLDSNQQIKLTLDDTNPNESLILTFLQGGLGYESDVTRVIQKILEPGDVFFDVGANIGYFTQLGSALVGPEGRVFAFEPDPKNIERIRFHCAENGFTNVKIIAEPASHAVEEVNFYFNKQSSGGNALWNPGEFFGDPDYNAGFAVMRSTTLAEEIAREGIEKVKLIKIDTEGAEHAILRGAGDWLTDGRIPFIIAELNGFGLDKLGSSKTDFIAFMYSRGYLAFLLYLDGRPAQFVGPGMDFRNEGMVNALFTTPEGFGRIWPVIGHNPGVMKDPVTGEVRVIKAA